MLTFSRFTVVSSMHRPSILYARIVFSGFFHSAFASKRSTASFIYCTYIQAREQDKIRQNGEFFVKIVICILEQSVSTPIHLFRRRVYELHLLLFSYCGQFLLWFSLYATFIVSIISNPLCPRICSRWHLY